MSWAEVKKINSDLATPLNIMDMVNHIEMVGSSYQGLGNIETVIDLMAANATYSSSVVLETIAPSFWDYVLNSTTRVGAVMDSIFFQTGDTQIQNATNYLNYLAAFDEYLRTNGFLSASPKYELAKSFLDEDNRFLLSGYVGVGQKEFTTPGTFSLKLPVGISTASVVAVGGGGGGGNKSYDGYTKAGAGGGLGWKNNISTLFDTAYAVVVGAGGAGVSNFQVRSGGDSYFQSSSLVKGGGAVGTNDLNTLSTPGGFVGDGGGNGGVGPRISSYGPGGGGAGGYVGNGGSGSTARNTPGYTAAANSGGAGGGGACNSGAGGGGTGIYGLGNTGAGGGGSSSGAFGGKGGSGGSDGNTPSNGTVPSKGGGYGGGGGGNYLGEGSTYGSDGAGGAVRIIWGPNRAFPATNTADM